MSQETLYCLDSSRNTSESLSVSDSLYKIIVETGGGIFVKVCHSEELVLWRSPATGVTLCGPLSQLSADVVRKRTHDSDSYFAATQETL